MSEKNQILFGLVGVIVCIIVACILAGIRATGSWENFLEALNERLQETTGQVRGPNATQPTANADPYTLSTLDTAFTNLLLYARDGQYSNYDELISDDWPLDVKALRPLKIRYYDNTNSPDAEGIFFVLETRKGYEVGVMRWIDRNPNWRNTPPGNLVKGTPAGGFRKMTKPGQYWHWYRPNRYAIIHTP